MKRTRIAHVLLVALLAVTGSACERIEDVAAPQFNANANANNGNANGKANAPGQQRNWTVVTISGGHGTISGLINASGGGLSLTNSFGTHTLSVPNAAVTGQPTTFTMRFMADKLGVELTAMRGSENVGAAGFKRAVTLCLAKAAVPEASRLAIAQLLSDGKLSVQTSTDTGTHICTELRHFSNYVMVAD